LVYVQAADCDQQCEQALVLLQQLYVGLGRKQTQVKPLLMAAQPPHQLTQFPAIDFQIEQIIAAELRNQIVIVNQHGMAILRYPLDKGSLQLGELAKDIRTDLLRLMNYDRSGA
jgi:hypothetical protein